jgi:hypothetical protein
MVATTLVFGWLLGGASRSKTRRGLALATKSPPATKAYVRRDTFMFEIEKERIK